MGGQHLSLLPIRTRSQKGERGDPIEKIGQGMEVISFWRGGKGEGMVRFRGNPKGYQRRWHAIPLSQLISNLSVYHCQLLNKQYRLNQALLSTQKQHHPKTPPIHNI